MLSRNYLELETESHRARLNELSIGIPITNLLISIYDIHGQVPAVAPELYSSTLKPYPMRCLLFHSI